MSLALLQVDADFGPLPGSCEPTAVGYALATPAPPDVTALAVGFRVLHEELGAARTELVVERQRLALEGATHHDTMRRLIAATAKIAQLARAVRTLTREANVLRTALEQCEARHG